MTKAPIIFLAAVAFLGAIASFLEMRKRQRQWRRVQGRVVEVKKAFDGETWMSAPVVSFRSEQGDEVVFTDSVSTSTTLLSAGDRVEVLYDPRNPKRASLIGWRRYFLPLFLLLVAAMLFGWSFEFAR